MAEVIEFYVRDLFPTNLKSVSCDRRGEVIEFPNYVPTVAGKTAKIRERDEGNPFTASWPGRF
jgi:hypothetical protein